MNLWRLEWLRLVRTRRLVAILAVYLFFGITGPFAVRYLNEILGRAGATSRVKIELPPPVPADAIAQFVSNASQIGLLVVVLVAASALAFDARREMAIFLRTRVDSVSRILVPALSVNAIAAVVGYVLGVAATWYETAVLIGNPPVGRMLVGLAYGALFLVFAVATVAAVASVVRGTLAAAGVALVVLLVMAVLGGIGWLGHWLPTGLAGALAAVVGNADPVDYLPAVGVSVVLTGLFVWFATAMGSRREI
jgi:ABC-2 type transport system permease protein